MSQLRKLFGTAPFSHRRCRIRPNHEIERHVVGIVLAHFAQRVDRERIALAIGFDCAHVKMWIVGNSQANHFDAIMRICNVLVFLEHGSPCGDEQHGVEVECLTHFLGNGQMSDMYGIERTAHDAETRRCAIGSQLIESPADLNHVLRPLRTNRKRLPFSVGLFEYYQVVPVHQGLVCHFRKKTVADELFMGAAHC